MTILSSPFAVLVAAVIYLVDQAPTFIPVSSPLTACAYLLSIAAMFLSICRLLYCFHRLLTGENYYYLPDAEKVLENICAIKAYCVGEGLTDDGQVTSLARINFIQRYAESAAKNCQSNDLRLTYRQGIFSSTTLAVIFAAFAFATIAVNQAALELQKLPLLWSISNARSSPGPAEQQAVPPTSAVSKSGSGDDAKAGGTSASAAATGH